MGEARFEYVLVSDVHLNEIVADSPEGWWEYKGRQSRQDDDIVEFLRALDGRRPQAYAGTEIIFNGDTFEFDLVYSTPEGQKARASGLTSDLPGSVYKMQRIVADHPAFICGLADFLARGNRAVFVMGNHDRELHFAEVQEVLVEALVAAAPAGKGPLIAASLCFEPWFVHRPGVLYAEHGQQYDATCSYRDVLDPVVAADSRHAPEIETPFGSLMGHHVLCHMGTFNPYNDEAFILSLGGYMKHMLRYYMPFKPFFRAYFKGSWAAIREMRARRKRARIDSRQQVLERYVDYGEQRGVSRSIVRDLTRLASRPISDRPLLLLHELWIDRFALIAVAVAVLIWGAMSVQTWTQGIALVALLPAIVWLFRAMGRGSLALQERARWGLVAEQISRSLGVPVVAFGHSHRPERRSLTGGGRYYNLGTWAPVVSTDRGSTLWRARRYLVLRPAGAGRVHAVFARWERGSSADSGDLSKAGKSANTGHLTGDGSSLSKWGQEAPAGGSDPAPQGGRDTPAKGRSAAGFP